jgi:hypothetical protein
MVMMVRERRGEPLPWGSSESGAAASVPVGIWKHLFLHELEFTQAVTPICC